ncbi:MAG: IS21 family transposase [Actinobacteria bacterium]|nr:MAG: IS21 family transposase [Actinomycetota bacterium]
MIDYATYCHIHALHKREKLTINQIARELRLHAETVSRWLKEPTYTQRQSSKRASCLDPFKGSIVRMITSYDYTATQLLKRIREAGYEGGYTILKDYVRQVRPPRNTPYLTLSFEPGECAQVDWGSAGVISVGNTRRRLSFFVMVLCYSRMLYVEFTLGETQEQWLACHEHAFEYFGRCPQRVMVDNLKSAVLSHPAGQPAVYHPRYMDLAGHYGFEICACNVGAPNEKGRVENGVRYVKSSFLRGLELEQFAPLNPAARQWLDTVANVRVHAMTHKRPVDLFKVEKPTLRQLPVNPYDVGVSRPVTASAQFRVTLDTNRYSVPSEYASRRLIMRVYPDRVVVYHDHRLIADHPRRYDRHQDYINPDHQSALLQQKRRARQQQRLMHLLRLTPQAEEYYRQLEERRLNPGVHIRKIIALVEIYGEQAVGRAIDDALEYQAFSSEYIANILEQRARQLPEAGALHLTRREDLLELELPEPDLSIYDSETRDTEKDQAHD